MVQKVTDISPRQERPQNQENIKQPEAWPQPEGVEIYPEHIIEQLPQMPTEAQLTPKKKEAPFPSPPTFVAPQIQPENPILEKIENILEKDLEQIYFQMPPQKQAEFAKVGDETASKISVLLQEVKVQVKKILELIIRWLKIIPGVNKYFLEQEAKIKTDELLKLRDELLPPQGPLNKNKI